MEEKLWETEYWVINFATGTMERVISDEYVPAMNAQQAAEKLVASGKPWLRLTGQWFNQKQEVIDHNEFYEKLSTPSVLTEDMNFDEFLDWLDLGTEEDVQAAIKAFEKDGLDEHVKVMKVHLKLKYGKKKGNSERKGSDDNQEEGETTR